MGRHHGGLGLLIFGVFCLFWTGAEERALGDSGPRVLAPGILTVIAPPRDEGDTFSGPREMVEIVRGLRPIDWQPNYAPKSDTLAELAKKITYRRSIWYLEFSFKPLRMTYVDVPQADGGTERALIWYLVYKVRNPGFHLNPVGKPDRWGHELPTIERENHNVYFFPKFVLEGFDPNTTNVDRVLPVAVEKIRTIEDPGAGIKLHNSVEISEISIPVSTPEEDHSVWGVATWKDVDPQIDFFSVFVQRLTNAYRWEDPENGFQPGDPPGKGRVYRYKTLQLNFWRPGDAIREHPSEIRLGMPAFEDVQGTVVATEQDLLDLYGVEKPCTHQWVFRP